MLELAVHHRASADTQNQTLHAVPQEQSSTLSLMQLQEQTLSEQMADVDFSSLLLTVKSANATPTVEAMG